MNGAASTMTETQVLLRFSHRCSTRGSRSTVLGSLFLVPGPYLVLGSVLGPGFLVHPASAPGTRDEGRTKNQGLGTEDELLHRTENCDSEGSLTVIQKSVTSTSAPSSTTSWPAGISI
jgi:hypothetical protein